MKTFRNDKLEMKKITISDVAEALQVSKTTVSRAISGKGRIGEATRQKVLEYIEANDYKPNVIAKGLAQQKTYNIALAIPGDCNLVDMPFFQNNITTQEHPLGVYHPHAKLHHIKKENIGLIEVMGLAVLPSRLKDELEQLANAVVAGEDIRQNEVLEKHADWIEEILPKYDGKVSKENIMDILQKEVGIVFGKVLEHAGVFKRDEKGQAAFDKFISAL